MFGSHTSPEQQFSPEGLLSLSQRIGPIHALQRVADRMAVTIPEIALQPDRFPIEGRALQTSRIANSTRSLYLGGDHGLLVAFLNEAVSRRDIQLPIRVGNFDFHADVNEYQAQHKGYTASWQRLGMNLGLWRSCDSFNIRPPHSNAPPMYQDIVTDIPVNDFENHSPFDLVSIDLDYFNDLVPEDEKWREGIRAMKSALATCKVAMIFSSPGWTFGHLSEKLVNELARELTGYYCGKNV